jgi:VWFA-related protein
MIGMRAARLLLAVTLIAQLRAADPQEVRIRSGPYAFPQANISVQTDLVESGVTVRDRRGDPVGGFTVADFELLDNGRPQEISFFSERRAAPAGTAQGRGQGQPAGGWQTGRPLGPPAPPAARSLAFFFDDTHASVYDSKAVQGAEKLVSSGLEPGDRVALFTGSGAVTVDFTSDHEKLLAALQLIRPHPIRKELDACVTMDPYQAYSIANHLDWDERQLAIAKAIRCNCPSGDPECIKAQPAYVEDASQTSWDIYRHDSEIVLDVLQIAVNRLAAMPGNRILVMLSRGFVTGGMDRRKSAIVNAALRAHIVFNALNTEGLTTRNARNEGLRQNILSEMMAGVSGATGGRFFKNTNDIERALGSLAAPPEVSYTLGFAPAREADDTYHSLRIRVKNGRGYQVEARQGYWAEKARPAAGSAQRRIDQAVLSGETIAEIPTTLRVILNGPKAGAPDIVVRVSVDARHLRFLKKGGRSCQELTFVAVLETAGGEYLAGKQAVMDLALTGPKLASMQASGIKAVMSFAAPPGTYAIRSVVREADENRIAAASARFDVR